MSAPSSPATAAACPLHLAISGMHCAACSSRIEKVVGRLPGVAHISVNLASARAEILPAPDAPADVLPAILARIDALGFHAEPAQEDDIRHVWEDGRRKDAAELAAQRARLLPLFLLTVPLLLLSMGHMFGLPLPAWLNPARQPAHFALAQLALSLPALWLGRHFYRDGGMALLRRAPTMDSLVAVGTGAAFAYSLWQTLRMALCLWLPAAMGLSATEALTLAHGLSMDLYYESCVMLLCMISLGQYLEHRSRRAASDALGALLRLMPEQAVLLRDGQPVDVPLADVRQGDIVLVRPGTRVPVDGVVLEGRSAVDLSLLTGESMPVAVSAGDTLTGGSLNTAGVLTLRADHVGGETCLARMLRLVRDAQGSKAPIARLADTLSFYFVPCVIGVAALSALLWLTVGGESAGTALRIFVAVLVIACPCAMGLATPMSLMVATGRGAREGVLIRNGAALEQAEKITVLAVDKTGTLTTGSPSLTDIIPLMPPVAPTEKSSDTAATPNAIPAAGTTNTAEAAGATAAGIANTAGTASSGTAAGTAATADAIPTADTTAPYFSSGTLLEMAASLEAGSEHPLAEALRAAARARGLSLRPVTDIVVTPGMGIAGLLDGKRLTLGNVALLREAHIPLDGETLRRCDALADAGRTPLLLAVDTAPAAIFGLADTLRPESAEVVAQLRAWGLRVIMLSGDSERTAHAVAREAGITEVIAGVLPQDKARVVRELQAQGHIVGMVGDGMNDAPALAQAHVGFAVGGGVDVSVETGDMVLTRHGMRALLTALTLSRATMHNIRQNLGWAFGYNLLGIPVAAGVLHIFGGPTLSPMLAGTAMAFSSVSVVLNALRLRQATL